MRRRRSSGRRASGRRADRARSTRRCTRRADSARRRRARRRDGSRPRRSRRPRRPRRRAPRRRRRSRATPTGGRPQSSPASRPTFAGLRHDHADELERRIGDHGPQRRLADVAGAPHDHSMRHGAPPLPARSPATQRLSITRQVVAAHATARCYTTPMLDADVVIAGAGIGGSALATVLARAGLAVLVLEKETEYRDRVRGEWIAPWGVVEAKRLGLYETLRAGGGHHVAEHRTYHDALDADAARAQHVRPRAACCPDVPVRSASATRRCAASSRDGRDGGRRARAPRRRRHRARRAGARPARRCASRTTATTHDGDVPARGRRRRPRLGDPQAGRHRAPPRPDPSSLRRPPRRGRRRLAGDRAEHGRRGRRALPGLPAGERPGAALPRLRARAAPAARTARTPPSASSTPSACAACPRPTALAERAPGRPVPLLRQRGHLDRRAGRRRRRADRRRRRPQRSDHRPGALDHAPRRPHRARHPARRRATGRPRRSRPTSRSAASACAACASSPRSTRSSRTSSAPTPKRAAPARASAQAEDPSLLLLVPGRVRRARGDAAEAFEPSVRERLLAPA